MDTSLILSEDVRANIEITARGMIGMAGYTKQDLDDIKQDLTCELLRKVPCFDPSRATFNTFQQVVVSRYANSLLRRRLADKRQEDIRPVSLDETVPTEGGEAVALEATIDDDETAIRMGWRSRDRRAVSVLRADVAAVIEELPEIQRDCCFGLMDGRSVSELARSQNMRRGRYCRRVFNPLRRVFAAAGLQAAI